MASRVAVDAPADPEAAEVVVLVGIPGAGKTSAVGQWTAGGSVRLNRDERGGSLADIAAALDEALAAGAARVVLDNTYLTRAARSHIIDVTRRHGAAARSIWLDTPLAQAQVNLVLRLLDRFGCLPTPEQVRAASRREAGIMAPTSQMRALRELEPPTIEEGFAAVEHVPFSRTSAAAGGGGVLLAAAALTRPGWQPTLAELDPAAPHLLFDWRPEGNPAGLSALAHELEAVVEGPVEAACCPHRGGPPACWCRPPLPGLPLAFARTHDVDLTRSVLLGTSAAHRTLASTLGARSVGV